MCKIFRELAVRLVPQSHQRKINRKRPFGIYACHIIVGDIFLWQNDMSTENREGNYNF